MSKKYDLAGLTFGKLTVIDKLGSAPRSGGRTEIKWKCVCDCGNEVIASTANLNNGKCIQCYQCAHDLTGLKRRQDLTGETYCKLTVKKMLYNYNNTNKTKCLCDCECGKTDVIKEIHNEHKQAKFDKKSNIVAEKQQEEIIKRTKKTKEKIQQKLAGMTAQEKEVYVSQIVTKLRILSAEISDKKDKLATLSKQKSFILSPTERTLVVVSTALFGSLVGGTVSAHLTDVYDSITAIIGGTFFGSFTSLPIIDEIEKQYITSKINNVKKQKINKKINKLNKQKDELSLIIKVAEGIER